MYATASQAAAAVNAGAGALAAMQSHETILGWMDK